MSPAPRFRSTAAFTSHRRAAAPVVERATFVLFTLGPVAFAAPVEVVERVLRRDGSRDTVEQVLAERAGQDTGRDHAVAFDGVRLPLVRLELGDALSTTTEGGGRGPDATRVLVFTLPDRLVAVAVDTVFDVATIDASTIATVRPEDAEVRPLPRGVRGTFVRHGRELFVLDVSRLVPPVRLAS